MERNHIETDEESQSQFVDTDDEQLLSANPQDVVARDKGGTRKVDAEKAKDAAKDRGAKNRGQVNAKDDAAKGQGHDKEDKTHDIEPEDGELPKDEEKGNGDGNGDGSGGSGDGNSDGDGNGDGDSDGDGDDDIDDGINEHKCRVCRSTTAK